MSDVHRHCKKKTLTCLSELDKRLIRGCDRCSEVERGHSVQYEEEPVPQQRHLELGRKGGFCQV